MDRLQFRANAVGGAVSLNNPLETGSTISHAIKGDAEVAHQEFLVHDTFRHGFRQLSSELQPGHPLEDTLVNASSQFAPLHKMLTISIL